MNTEIKTLMKRESSVSIKGCDDVGIANKKGYATLTLEYGKTDICEHKELAEVLVRFATDLLIEARQLEKKDCIAL